MIALHLPGRGCFRTDIGTMWEPHKIGNVMWARVPSGEMVPVDLHGELPDSDYRMLNQIYGRLKAYRAVMPAIQVIQQSKPQRMDLMKPYLIETMRTRSEARALTATGDWDAIWSVL